MKKLKLPLALAMTLVVSACQQNGDQDAQASSTDAVTNQLSSIVDGEHRAPEHRERDPYRHPVATLRFFDVAPDDRVIEINPGGGWYMEILGPFLKGEGQYIAVTPDPEIEGMPSYVVGQAASIQARIEEQSELYGNALVHFYDPSEPVFGEPGSADKVLTFRNVHNWINGEQAEAMFEAFADVLKPGGVLGVVQHRAPEGAKAEQSAREGYVPEAAVIALAEAAGLELDASSEINANPRDARDHPHGVWTLPPTLRLGEERADHYMSIGESDRMTLRFVKP